MSEDEKPVRSDIPTGIYFLLLGISLTVVIAYFTGFTSPLFIMAIVVVIGSSVLLGLSLRNWSQSDPATRPKLKFPTKSVLWTIGIVGTLYFVITGILDGISDAYRF